MIASFINSETGAYAVLLLMFLFSLGIFRYTVYRFCTPGYDTYILSFSKKYEDIKELCADIKSRDVPRISLSLRLDASAGKWQLLIPYIYLCGFIKLPIPVWKPFTIEGNWKSFREMCADKGVSMDLVGTGAMIASLFSEGPSMANYENLPIPSHVEGSLPLVDILNGFAGELSER